MIDPSTFAWTDAGVARHRATIATCSTSCTSARSRREGTWAAATEQLPFLAELGITTIEVMPVAEFAGRHNWGYDGVNLFAPTHRYGTPDDLRRFVDRAHALGLAVILDVVYNHFGPAGNSMFELVAALPQRRHMTEWGDALDFDGTDSAAVREYFVANAGYWIDEFHLDGLRLDATQAIVDDSPTITSSPRSCRRARDAARGRTIFIVGENEPQDVALLGRRSGSTRCGTTTSITPRASR